MTTTTKLTRNKPPKRARNGAGKFLRTPENRARDAEAARLRSRGRTLRSIAAELGYTDEACVLRGINKIWAETCGQPLEDTRNREIATLDELEEEAWACLRGEHSLAAVDRVLRIQERRARLLGLDAPVRAQVEVTDAATAEIERLAAQLGMTEPVKQDPVEAPDV